MYLVGILRKEAGTPGVISLEDCVSSPSTYLAVLIRSRGKGGEADSRSMITDQLLPLLRLVCNPVDQHPRRGPWSPKWKCPYLFDLGTTVPSYHPRADPRPPPETRFLHVLSGYPWTHFGSALRIFFTATSASRCGRGSRSGARISSLGLRIRSATSAARSRRRIGRLGCRIV